MTNETKNEWLMREHLERLVFAIGPMRAETDVVESARAALPDLVERRDHDNALEIMRAMHESDTDTIATLRTRVAELEARWRDLCDSLNLHARDVNGEILNDPDTEDVLQAIERPRLASAPSVAPAAPVEASEAQPDYWMRVKIEHASRELARMESFREQDIDAAFRIAATFTAAARSAKGGSGQ
jgi:hypothetical protein